MAGSTALDDTDLRILAALRKNARQTLGEIGRQVGLSAPAVKRRVDRLEATETILGYTTIVDHARLGETLEAFTELRFGGNTPVDAIEGVADEIPEIQGFFTTAGDPDALAWIRVRDVDHLKQVIDRIRKKARVSGTKTMMVLGSAIRPRL